MWIFYSFIYSFVHHKEDKIVNDTIKWTYRIIEYRIPQYSDKYPNVRQTTAVFRTIKWPIMQKLVARVPACIIGEQQKITSISSNILNHACIPYAPTTGVKQVI